MADWPGRNLLDRADIARAVAQLAAGDRAGMSTLARAVQTGDQTELTPDRSRLLPCLPELADVLPWPGGLLKGATVCAVGSTSLRLALLAGAMTEGSYAAVVGQPDFGAHAALSQYGIAGERLALVPDPGPDWPTVVGALIDGVDLVVVHAPGGASDGVARSLQARARERGCVLIPTTVWPGAELVMERTAVRWSGLGLGRGRLRRQHATFEVRGRGRATRPRTLEMTFPLESITGVGTRLSTFNRTDGGAFPNSHGVKSNGSPTTGTEAQRRDSPSRLHEP